MDRFLGLLGLSMKAGQVIWGANPVEAGLLKARLLVLASDAGASTERNARHLAEKQGIALLIVPYTKIELGHSIGKKPCALVSVTDRSFATQLERIHF